MKADPAEEAGQIHDDANRCRMVSRARATGHDHGWRLAFNHRAVERDDRPQGIGVVAVQDAVRSHSHHFFKENGGGGRGNATPTERGDEAKFIDAELRELATPVEVFGDAAIDVVAERWLA